MISYVLVEYTLFSGVDLCRQENVTARCHYVTLKFWGKSWIIYSSTESQTKYLSSTKLGYVNNKSAHILLKKMKQKFVE